MRKTKATLLNEAINLVKKTDSFDTNEREQINTKLEHLTTKELIQFINGERIDGSNDIPTISTPPTSSEQALATSPTQSDNFKQVLTSSPTPTPTLKPKQIFQCSKCDFKARDENLKCPRHNCKLVKYPTTS